MLLITHIQKDKKQIQQFFPLENAFSSIISLKDTMQDIQA